MITLNLSATRALKTPVLMVQRPSAACERALVEFRHGAVVIAWRSGHFSKHITRRRDILRLLLPGTSMGQWANRHLLQRHSAVSV